MKPAKMGLDIDATSKGAGNKSWMSLCLAATKLMDEKTQSDATTDPEEDDGGSGVNNLLCFETIGGESTCSGNSGSNDSNNGNINRNKHGISSDPNAANPKRRKKEIPILVKRNKNLKPTRYIRGVPAISKRDIAWNVMFKRLQEFKHEYGHCNVPQGFATDLELATWVKNQRQAYRYMLDNKTDKKPTKRISPDRVTRLNHLGFEWRKYVRADDWSDHYFGKRTTTPRQKMSTNPARTQPESTQLPDILTPLQQQQQPPPGSLAGPMPQPYGTSSEDVNSTIPAELLCDETL